MSVTTAPSTLDNGRKYAAQCQSQLIPRLHETAEHIWNEASAVVQLTSLHDMRWLEKGARFEFRMVDFILFYHLHSHC